MINFIHIALKIFWSCYTYTVMWVRIDVICDQQTFTSIILHPWCICSLYRVQRYSTRRIHIDSNHPLYWSTHLNDHLKVSRQRHRKYFISAVNTRSCRLKQWIIFIQEKQQTTILIIFLQLSTASSKHLQPILQKH